MTNNLDSIKSSGSKYLLDQELVASNVQALREGSELIRLLKGDQYVRGFTPAFQSTIGAHFRHVLEHYRCFNSQIGDKIFCYDKRERDQKLECDSQYALETIDELIENLLGLAEIDDKNPALLQGEFNIEDEQTSSSVSTTVNRELLFLQSHTVHHYAIVGAMTRAFGNKPDADFGVAIATRSHNERCAESSASALSTKGVSCAQ